MPVDSKDFFNKINDAQLSWYQMQSALDEKDQFELLRDVAEHNAMFWNPEGVQQMRDTRENTFKTPTDEFQDMLKDSFGRDVDFETNNSALTEDVLKNIARESNMDPFLNMDLDEVAFIPYDDS